MAVNAKFVADFSSFNAAIEKADVKLADFAKGASKVESALNRMVDGFSGRKLIQDAALMTEAIKRVGGVSQLTQSELASMGNKAKEAVEKMKALGIQVPPELQKLAKAAHAAEVSTGGLTTRMIALGTAAGTFLGRLAYDAIKRLGMGLVEIAGNGIKLAAVTDAFHRLARATGESGEAMLRMSRSATKGLISDLELMQAGTKGLLLGLPITADSMATLAQTAVVLGKAMGQGPVKSFDDLITALGRSSPMILDNLGLSVKVGEANEKYAKSLGKTAEQLTEAEKKMAFYTAAMDAAKQKVEDLGGIHLTLADRVQQAQVAFKNFTDALGVAIATSPVINAVFGSVAESISSAFGENQTVLVQRLMVVVNQFAMGVADVASVGITAAGLMGRAWSALQLVFAGTASVVTGVGLAFAKLIALANETAAALPGIGRAYADLALAARNFEVQLGGIQQSFHDQAQEALNGAEGNSAFQRTLDTVSKSLSTMKQRMADAANQQVSTDEIARRLTKTTDGLGESNADAARKAKAYAERLKEVNEKIQQLLAPMKGLSMAQVDQILGYQRLGLSVADIVIKLKLSEVTVQSVIDVTKKMTDGFLTTEKALQDLGTTAVSSTGMIQDGLGQALLKMQAFTAAAAKPVTFDLDAVFDIGKVQAPDVSDMVGGIDWKVITASAKSSLQEQADTARRTYEHMRAHSDLFTDAAIRNFKRLADEAEAEARGTQTAWQRTYDALGDVNTILSQIPGKFAEIGAVAARTGQAIMKNLAEGDLLGAVVSGVTGAIQAIKTLFGGISEEVKKARAELDKLIMSFRELGALGTDFEVLSGTISDLYKDLGRDGESARRVLEKLMDTDHPERYAEALREVNAAIEEQKTRWEGVEESVAALNAFVKDGVGELGRYNIASKSAVAIFDAWVKKTGDVVGALDQIGPALDALDFQGQMKKIDAERQALMKKGIFEGKDIDALDKQWDAAKANLAAFGEAGGAAIEQLLGLRRVTEANRGLIAQIGQSTALLKGLGKAGLLTEDLVMSFGQNAVNQFALLEDATGDARSAMVLMQPQLQALWEHQQKFGMFADEATQALIDQAATSGLVGEDMKSDQQQLLDVLKQVRDVLYTIAGIKIPDKTFDVTPNIEPIEIPDFPTRAVDTPDFASQGGRVTAQGIQHFAGGGTVLPFRPRGTDTVPAMLTPGETVRTAAQEAALAEPRQPVVINLIQDGMVATEILIDNILKDTKGIRRVIKRVAR